MAQTVSHAMRIIEFAGEGPRTLGGVAQPLGVQPLTALRLLRTLSEGGLTLRRPDGRCGIGYQLVGFAQRPADQFDLRELVTVVLRDRQARAAPRGAARHGTASVSRAVLANLPREHMLLLLEGWEYTPTTISSREAFLKELDVTQKRGWAIDDGKFEDSVNCIAYPFREDSGHVIGTTSITALRGIADVAGVPRRARDSTRCIIRDPTRAAQEFRHKRKFDYIDHVKEDIMEAESHPSSRWIDPPVRYPDPAVRVLDERFTRYRIGSAAVERIATGYRWVEGPVWFGDHNALVWSDVPSNTMWRWDEASDGVTAFRSPSNFSNGNTRDRQGRLITCEHLGRRVTRTEPDGNLTVLADSFEGRRLNSPNDVVVTPDGAIWFSDPTYGIVSDYEGDRAEPELPTAVYRLAPESGTLTTVITDLVQPNGLCFSPDGSLLYVVDSGTSPGNIHVYDVEATTVSNGRLFADMGAGSSDGVRCDTDGNVWASAAGGGPGYDGVHVFAPDGTRIGQIDLPEQCANIVFGGRKRNRLFMAASQSIYSLYVNASGCP